jgi:hypothetical protein
MRAERLQRTEVGCTRVDRIEGSRAIVERRAEQPPPGVDSRAGWTLERRQPHGKGLVAPGAEAGGPDGGGVLGNLPRSRPGPRSDKRAAEASTAAPRAARRERTKRSAPARATTDQGAETARASGRTPPPPESAGSALGDAARVAGRAARLGIDLAGGILKRIPRP